MTVTRSRNSTFELCTCGQSMISWPTTFLLVGAFTNFHMSNLWFKHKLFSPYSWWQDMLL
jgi:hypothetical protein